MLRRRFPRRPRAEGELRVLGDIASADLGNSREVCVFLPPGYAREPERRFPVIYLQDGQNLFEPHKSFAGAWGADQAMLTVARLGYEAILVGIANTGLQRLDEYSAWHDGRRGGGRADTYLALLTETIKPRVDAEFRTHGDRRFTHIGGSSMGGLLALYAYFRCPQTFGGALVQSPALWFAQGRIFEYVAEMPAPPGRIYLDCGTREGENTLANARRMRDLLESRGYHPPHGLRWIEDPNGTHHESCWGRRLRKALPFLLDDDQDTP
jgi:predicted alpha/beta superfamily hydrolase